MQFVRHIEEIPFAKKSVVTIGTFDGVHCAHQKILERVVTNSKKMNGRSVVITFEPHPREVLSREGVSMKLLTTIQERGDICAQFGIDWFVAIEFTNIFSQTNFKDFIIKYIYEKVGMGVIVEGYDYHWGKDREGNVDALIALGKEYDFAVERMEQFTMEGIPVNSSSIRSDLIKGSLERANSFLGYPYALSGVVVEGEKRGRRLGYPTINIVPETGRKVVPKDGIYFVQVFIEKEVYFGMASIGIRPTFHLNGERTIEVHILDYKKDIYGYDVRIAFLERLRDEIHFSSAELLVQQMRKDETLCRNMKLKYERRP